MNHFVFSEKSKQKYDNKQSRIKGELIDFVADQFKKIAKRNLKIPVTLYHL